MIFWAVQLSPQRKAFPIFIVFIVKESDKFFEKNLTKNFLRAFVLRYNKNSFLGTDEVSEKATLEKYSASNPVEIDHLYLIK